MSLSVSGLIAELLPIAESLFALIDKIKTDAPDAWASVSAEYVQAAQAWKDAKLAATPEPLHASIAPQPEPSTSEPETPPQQPTAAPHTLTTAEQVAAGIAPANYAPS